MTTSDGLSDRKLRFWALGLALLLGAIESVKGWVAGRDAPNDFGWTKALITNLPWWLLWGLAALLVFGLVRRFPLRREDGLGNLALHVAASVGISAAHLAGSALIVWLTVSHVFLSLETQIRQIVVGYLVTDLVTYWAIAAGYGAWITSARARAAERERQALELRNARLEAQMGEARLSALRRELNPHFLFNTLNTVSALAQRGDGKRAVTAIARLSELLRRVLDDELDDLITVEEEIGLLELYLDIVRLRFGSRLTIDVRVDPAAREALVPSLVVQPLAENAVRHGVESTRGACELHVQASAIGGRLEFTVRNTASSRGRLAPAGGREDRPGVASSAPGGPRGPGGGVGLRNTRERLRTLYGRAADLTLRSVDDGRAVEAVIILPLTVESEVRLRA